MSSACRRATSSGPCASRSPKRGGARGRARHGRTAPRLWRIHPLGKIPGLRHGEVTLCDVPRHHRLISWTRFRRPAPRAGGGAGEDAERRLDLHQKRRRFETGCLVRLVSVRSTTLPGTRRRSARYGGRSTPMLPEVEGANTRRAGGRPRYPARSAPIRHGRVDAYLIPILFYVRTLPDGGPMIAARSRLRPPISSSAASIGR